MRRTALLLALLASLAPAAPLAGLAPAAAAAAAQPRFSMEEIEAELMCPTCGTRLDMSQAPAANQIRTFVARKRAEGWTKKQVEDALVADYGEAVLAAPPAKGIGVAAWVLPIGVAALAIVAVGGVALAARRRGRERLAEASAGLDDDLERRVDGALADYDP